MTHHSQFTRVPRHPDEEASLPILTLVLWCLCLAVGWAGLVFPSTRPRAALPPPEPVRVMSALEVELTPEPAPSEPEPLPPPPVPMPPPVPTLPSAEVPRAIDVTEPWPPSSALPRPSLERPALASTGTPSAATAVPATPPTRSDSVEAKPAGPSAGLAAPTAEATPLVFGQGQGKQPAPDYPRAAVRQGQEGSVRLRLNVDEDGRVREAKAVVPCPWPLLNEAALRVVRERWRFHAAHPRIYEVTIRFEIKR